MKKFINNPVNFVNETIEGILSAYPEYFTVADRNIRALVKRNIIKGKVGIVTGGGSGHLPLFLGYIGNGLVDGCAIGNVFASPSAKSMYDVAKYVDSGMGILYLFGNYGGDTMNFKMASKMASSDGIKVELLCCNDDVASANKGEEKKRRGVAGIFFAYKISGAAADEMLSLEEVTAITQKAINNTRTMGVALSSCTIPEAGKPTFFIGENEMELGMGIHGEPGISKGAVKDADEICEAILNKIIIDLPFFEGDEVAVLINGLGATPKEELFIIYRKTQQILKEKNISVYKSYIGEYVTSMEMSGMSISLMKLDDELKHYVDRPAYSPLLNLV